MRRLLLPSVVSLVAGVALIGCSVDPSDGADSTSDQLSAEDLQLARTSAALIAGANGRCTSCHTAGQEDIRRWGSAMKTIEDTCLSPSLSLTALERVNCMKDDPSDEASGWSPTKLGLYAAGATLPVMETLFKQAYPAEQWQAKYEDFKMFARMPLSGSTGFTANEFTTVKNWALRGTPGLETVLAEPGAFPCETKTTPELFHHIATMKTDGWAARHADARTPMAQCGAATSAIDCLQNQPDVTADFGAAGTVQKLRGLRKLEFRSNYWTRSSPDGRFAAFGGSPSRIVDLDHPDAAPITVRAPYDPGFFPNNDGFSFAGTQAGGLRVCKQSVLLNALTSADHTITLGEAGCTQIINTVYQSIGAALDGSLYFMATGAHTNDAGGSSGPLAASFGENAVTTLTPMFNDGTKYVPGTNLTPKFPFEGDQQMSPSNTLLITRFGQRAGTSGYRIRSVKPTFRPSADASGLPAVSVETKELATVCLAGGKAQLSFEERFLAVHQYTDPNDNPQGLPLRTANIFVMDLKTGKTYQVTNVKANTQALYPHWRADGWLYFLVKESSGEHFVASDVALHLE